MGFLDNSGDIILDAVLTDLGRQRLARGDGSFKITKFALGDDEIDYGNYNKNHSSGSAYYDLEVLQTPVLEAFTNNASSMKSRLMSLSRNDILYLPILQINNKRATSELSVLEDAYVIACDSDTENLYVTSNKGVLYGVNASNAKINVHQGLDTEDLSWDTAISSDLKETQYLVELDNRLGSIYTPDKSTAATVSFIDDDNIAFYYFTTSDTDFVKDIDSNVGQYQSPIAGPRGTQITLGIQASIDLQTGTSLFTRLGSTVATVAGQAPTDGLHAINSTLRISGVTTGFRLDIPLKFIKKV